MHRAAAILVVFAVACGDVSQAPSPFVVEDPPKLVYDETHTPRVNLPEDPSALAALTPPLAQEGRDSGDEGLIYAAALGGYYIARIQEPDGSFGYRYDPRTDVWSNDDSLARQCGSTYTLSLLYATTGREEFRIAAEWSHTRIAARMPTPLALTSPVALQTLGLTLHSKAVGNTDWAKGFDVDQALERLGAYLLETQRDDGSFLRGGFHAGAQFLQALWALYDHTGQEVYLDALERGARFFYDTGSHDRDLLFALWANEALTNLYTVRPAPWIPALVWEVTDPIIAVQILPHHDVPDHWTGGFYTYASPTPGAMSMYGVESAIDAWRLADMVGDETRAERYRAASILGVRFLKAIQFRVGETDQYAQGDMMLGGVPYGFGTPILRVDITRHLSNTLVKVVTYLGLEEIQRP